MAALRELAAPAVRKAMPVTEVTHMLVAHVAVLPAMVLAETAL
jgi:hypothetical protein